MEVTTQNSDEEPKKDVIEEPRRRLVPLEPDPIVKQSGRDAAADDRVYDTIVFTGYLGRGLNDRWRLYFTLQMDTFIEFENKDVAWCASGPSVDNPMRSTALGLNSSAAIDYVTTPAPAPAPAPVRAASFLQGGIAQGSLPTAGMSDLGNKPGAVAKSGGCSIPVPSCVG